MNNVDLMLARAQVGLAMFCAMGIFGLVFTLLLLPVPLDTVRVTIITSLLSVLATVFTLQMNFFYARTRPPALPDPSSNSTTTTTSGPSATTVAVTPLVQTQPETKQ